MAYPGVALGGFPTSGDTRDLVGPPLPLKPQWREVSLREDRDHVNRFIEVVIQPTSPVFPPLRGMCNRMYEVVTYAIRRNNPTTTPAMKKPGAFLSTTIV